VGLSVLRLIEEEAMKKGTDRVIAHLPIECATFLLNEKRTVIEQMEHRLQVRIILLPSRHLETPAYDIERIKIKETEEEDKASYLQLKAEEIVVPEFVQHSSFKIERPTIKEFLPDLPAPVQNKKTSANLIRRFWQKLIADQPSISVAAAKAEVVETVAPVVEKLNPEEPAMVVVESTKSSTSTQQPRLPYHARHKKVSPPKAEKNIESPSIVEVVADEEIDTAPPAIATEIQDEFPLISPVVETVVEVPKSTNGRNHYRNRRRQRTPYYRKSNTRSNSLESVSEVTTDLVINDQTITSVTDKNANPRNTHNYVYMPSAEMPNPILPEPVLIIPLIRSEQSAKAKPPYSHEFAQRIAKRVKPKSLEVAIHHEIVKHKVEQQQRMIAEIIKQRELDSDSSPNSESPSI
jgi:ribonuclease E